MGASDWLIFLILKIASNLIRGVDVGQWWMSHGGLLPMLLQVCYSFFSVDTFCGTVFFLFLLSSFFCYCCRIFVTVAVAARLLLLLLLCCDV